jgi:hypothetical protein
MSTSINQIIEVYKDGKWQYVPLAKKVTQDNNCLQKCGSVRDIFAYKWHNAGSFIQCGVPEDISKLAREAMIYDDQDFITSGACWISAAQYEALTEEIRQKFFMSIEKVTTTKMKDDMTKRLDSIEAMLKFHLENDKNAKKELAAKANEEDNDEDWMKEEMEDLMWAWVNMERNWAEIEAYVSYFTNDDYKMSDIRVIMFVS